MFMYFTKKCPSLTYSMSFEEAIYNAMNLPGSSFKVRTHSTNHKENEQHNLWNHQKNLRPNVPRARCNPRVSNSRKKY